MARPRARHARREAIQAQQQEHQQRPISGSLQAYADALAHRHEKPHPDRVEKPESTEVEDHLTLRADAAIERRPQPLHVGRAKLCRNLQDQLAWTGLHTPVDHQPNMRAPTRARASGHGLNFRRKRCGRHLSPFDVTAGRKCGACRSGKSGLEPCTAPWSVRRYPC